LWNEFRLAEGWREWIDGDIQDGMQDPRKVFQVDEGDKVIGGIGIRGTS
jgi:hypothetical protein